MEDVMTCIIFDAPFENEPGYGVAFLEDEDAARDCGEELRSDGFRAVVCGGHESPRRFWYLKTNAPLAALWCALSCFFDAYVRFEAQPGGGLQVRESCGCAGCREPIGSGHSLFEDSMELDAEKPAPRRGIDLEFDPPILN
jgi:hypothetical protein